MNNNSKRIMCSIPAGVIDFIIFWYLLRKQINLGIVILLTLCVIFVSISIVSLLTEDDEDD